jgi:hypothetical protein
LPGGQRGTVILPGSTYTLTIAGSSEDAALTGDLDIIEDLAITGAGRANTTLNADSLDRVFDLLGSPIVQISGVTITGGNSDFGGGIYVQSGELTLTNSRVTNNAAGGSGAGIHSKSTLTIIHSRLDNNWAYESGGGLFNSSSGSLVMIDNRVDNNAGAYGGGISNFGTANIQNSIINANVAGGTLSGGGGLYSQGTLTLVNSTLSGNSANSMGAD